MKEFEDFVEKHVETVRELHREKSLAHWRAATGGGDEDYRELAELEFKMGRIYSSRADFEYLSNLLDKAEQEDEEIARTARVLYLSYMGMQTGEDLLREIADLSSRLQRKFNTFRPRLDGSEVTDNDIREILREEKDSKKRKQAWEAHKAVGEVIAGDMTRLVELRNRAAAEAGFDNFYSMSLYLSETDEEELFRLMDRLEELTREPFIEVKGKLDQIISSQFGIPGDQIMPWHHIDPFFQRSRPVDGFDLDPLFDGRDLVRMAADYYSGLGMPVGHILESSDLYQRAGKSPHAFCLDIDREGDVRILANIKSDAKWMGTLLHELGHAVYDLNIDRELPFLLRKYPHFCLTEGSAMFFESMLNDPDWLENNAGAGLSDEQLHGLAAAAGAQKLVFARWCQVMVRFERELYRYPGSDLNSLWWEMAGRYQLVNPPPGRSSPDWCSKIHFVTSPVYYHNYLLGELVAAQLRNYIENNVAENFQQDGPEMSNYLKSNIYSPGNLYRWDRLMEKATGEPLKPDYFASRLEEI
ncbi:MAG: M2 family metallopeptidase [Candidatus Krumholzibacteriales bacterium]